MTSKFGYRWRVMLFTRRPDRRTSFRQIWLTIYCRELSSAYQAARGGAAVVVDRLKEAARSSSFLARILNHRYIYIH